jgi:hypothetical protein
MSDNEVHGVNDFEHEDNDYAMRILETRNKDRVDYLKNVGKLYADVLLTTRRQCADGQKEFFYISELKFMDGADPERAEELIFFRNLYKDLQVLNEKEVQKNANTVQTLTQKNKPIPNSVLNFVPLENITLVLRVFTYTHNQLIVFIRGPKMEEMYHYITDKYIAAKIGCHGYGDGANMFIMFTNKNVNVMTESDNVHRYAYQYFLDRNIIKREKEDDFIFGDDDIGML